MKTPLDHGDTAASGLILPTTLQFRYGMYKNGFLRLSTFKPMFFLLTESFSVPRDTVVDVLCCYMFFPAHLRMRIISIVI